MLKPSLGIIVVCGLLLAVPCCGSRKNTIEITVSRIGRRTVICACTGNNVAAVAARAGLVIIDTHRSPATMAAIKQRIEAETGRSDCLMVVNTHGDWDHCSGNQVFPDSLLCGQRNCPVFMGNHPADAPGIIWPLRHRVSAWRARAGAPRGDDGGSGETAGSIRACEIVSQSIETEYRPTPPANVFDDSLTVDGGDAAIELVWAGNAHTDSDVLIYVPQERLLFTGDLFTSAGNFGFAVNPMADVQRLLKVLDRFLARGIDYAVPGHGPVMTGADIRSLRTLLAERYSKYDGKRSAAKYLEDAIAANELQPALKKYAALPREGVQNYYRSQDELSILGRRLRGKGKTAEALAVFTAALQEFPKSALMYNNLGGLYLALGQRDSARQYYRLVLQEVPGNRDAEAMLEGLDNEAR